MITMEHVCKSYRVAKRNAGMREACKALFRREVEIIHALSDVSFTIGDGEMVGQCGLTMQPWKGEEVLEIGYLFCRRHWHRGYATEAALACKEYAFRVLGAEEVCSIIRDTNLPSQRVAARCGMTKADSWVKHYRGVDMPHDRYLVRR